MEFYRYVVEGMLLPVGPMMQDAQASTAAARQQLASDLSALEAYNAPIEMLNGRARELLTEVSGLDYGAERQPWERWYVDLLGYAYGSSATPPKTERPTVVEQVPLDHEAQAPPKIAYQGPSNVTFLRYSCFGAGTPVTTLEGRRPIEDLRAGDMVLSRDAETGALAYRPLSAVFHNPPDSTYRIDLGGEPIVSTGIHRFWKAGEGWVMARDLKAGDRLRTIGGVAQVRSVVAQKVQPVYNLQVAGGDNFFVGAEGVQAHDNSLVTPVEKPFDRVLTIEGLPRAARGSHDPHGDFAPVSSEGFTMPSSPDPRQPTDPAMAAMAEHPLEPLRAFRGLAEAVAPGLRAVEAAHARYREERDAGRILANSVEALRVELTYHSNAIEGSTLASRQSGIRKTRVARTSLECGGSRAKASPAEVVDARTSRIFDAGMAIDFHRSEPDVFDLLERESHGPEVDVSRPELSAVALAEVHVPQRRAAIDDRLGERVLLDIQMDRVHHRSNRGDADRVDQCEYLRDGIVEADLEVIHRLDDDDHTLRPRRLGDDPQAVDDPPIGDDRIRFVTALTLEQADDEDGAELPGHVEIVS